MPKDKEDSDSTNRTNPYITKSISKTLLTPCRRVGLSRKRKTPNSSTSSFTQNETSPGNSQITPVTSKVASFEDKSESTTKNKTSEIAKKPKKSVSKCLIPEESDKTSPSFSPSEEINSLSNLESKKSEDADFSSDDSASDLPLVKFKEKLKNDKDGESKRNERFVVENEKSSSSQTSEENLKISAKKTKHDKTKTVTKKRLLIDDEKDDDFITKTSTSKMKKTEKKNVKKKKRLIIDEDDEDIYPISGVEKIEDQVESNAPFKGFHEKKENRVLSATEKYEKKKEERILSITEKDEKKKERVLSNTEKIVEKKEQRVLSIKEKSTDTKKETVLAVIPTENNIKKEEKSSRLKLRRSLSMKKSSDDLQEKSVILKDCSVNLIDTCKLKSENSDISEEEVNKLESKVESKRKIVEDLKQAEIYQRLHNVENLKTLTATWKNGCISALNDLLPHLQAQSQSSTDMKTLLKNLGVPDKLLITLSETGHLN